MKQKEKRQPAEAAHLRLRLRERLTGILALPLHRCLPTIALCILLCCMLTGYAVLYMEQRAQYRWDTFDVYMQEHAQPSAETSPLPEMQTAAVVPETTDGADPEQETIPEAVTDMAGSPVQLYATPSGARYHYDAACPGENAQEITWDEASRRGLTPCKRCAK